jgi:hypothetical protein
MTDRDNHAADLTSLLTLSSPRTDAPTTLPDAAKPDVECPGDEPSDDTTIALARQRPPQATLLDPATLALAQQHNRAPISSTAAAFLSVVVRRDLQLAPPAERRAIYNQAKRFETIGEAGAYARAVLAEIARAQLQHIPTRPRPSR